MDDNIELLKLYSTEALLKELKSREHDDVLIKLSECFKEEINKFSNSVV